MTYASQVDETSARGIAVAGGGYMHYMVNVSIVHTGMTQTSHYQLAPEEAFAFASQLQHAATEAMIEARAAEGAEQQ